MRDGSPTDPMRPGPSRPGRAWMSTATRRDVRQAVALATELNLFSVTLHGVTWTLYHPGRQPRPGPQSANRDTGNNAATSRRSERSAARQRAQRSEAQGLPGRAALQARSRFSQVDAAETDAATPAAAIRTHRHRSRHGPSRRRIKWCSHAAAGGADGDQRPLEASGAVVASRQRLASDATRKARAAPRRATASLPPSLPTISQRRKTTAGAFGSEKNW